MATATRSPLAGVFPIAPTPFTGYVITVPADDTMDLPITIEEALRMIVSGGVVVGATPRAATP